MLHQANANLDPSALWTAPRRHGGAAAPVVRAAVWPELAETATGMDSALSAPAAVVAPQPGLSEDEVARLCAGAAASAAAEVEARVRAELAGEADAAQAELASALRVLADAVATRRERLRADAVPIGAALGRLLGYRAIEAEPLAAAEAVVGELLVELGDGPEEVNVEVAPALVDDLRARMAAITTEASFPGRVEVRAGPGLRGGEVRLLWRDGWAERLLCDLDARAAGALEGLGRPGSAGDGPPAPAITVEHGRVNAGEQA